MRRALLITLPALAVAALAVPATARTKYDTSTTFEYAPLLNAGFFGQVSSPHAACVPKRKVTVFKVRSGDDNVVGSDRSADDGTWFVAKGDAGSAKYYVKVRGKDLSGHDSCRPYRSPSQRFGS